MKRLRDGSDPYQKSAAVRAAETKTFIKDLCFSKSLSALRTVPRAPCPKCNKRRQFYCYDCLAVCAPDSHPPPLALPINVHVVFHPGELRGKATSLAAATISPDVHIVEYPNIPPSLSPSDTLVLYPSESSVGLDELSTEEFRNFKNVVFVDATWQQSKAIARDERVASFRHVRIRERTSLFWRFQNNDPSYLATVEAIYYFLREFVTRRNMLQLQNQPAPAVPAAPETVAAATTTTATDATATNEAKYYHGEVDDLLFYYIHQYILVQESYQTGGNGNGSAAGASEATTADDGGSSGASPQPPQAEQQQQGQPTSTTTTTTTTEMPERHQREGYVAVTDDTGRVRWVPRGNPTNAGRPYTKQHFEGYLLEGVSWADVLAHHDRRLAKSE